MGGKHLERRQFLSYGLRYKASYTNAKSMDDFSSPFAPYALGNVNMTENPSNRGGERDSRKLIRSGGRRCTA